MEILNNGNFDTCIFDNNKTLKFLKDKINQENSVSVFDNKVFVIVENLSIQD